MENLKLASLYTTKKENSPSTGSSAWIETYTGKRFHILEPTEDEIDILDIAHAEANQCRFTGHVKNFYSVAEHSYYVSLLVPSCYALKALLHDASEAYISDLSRPLKHCTPLGTIYLDIEKKISDAIYAKFGLSEVDGEAEIKAADNAMGLTEHEQLFENPLSWDTDSSRFTWQGATPLSRERLTIPGYAPKYAERIFLARFRELTRTE